MPYQKGLHGDLQGSQPPQASSTRHLHGARRRQDQGQGRHHLYAEQNYFSEEVVGDISRKISGEKTSSEANFVGQMKETGHEDERLSSLQRNKECRCPTTWDTDAGKQETKHDNTGVGRMSVDGSVIFNS